LNNQPLLPGPDHGLSAAGDFQLTIDIVDMPLGDKQLLNRYNHAMLALVGSGEYLPPMEPVDGYLLRQLQEPPGVVCLPTAAGTEGPERIAYWSQLGVEHFRNLGAPVMALPVIDRASANNADFARMIAESNFVYLSGGKPDYLHQTLAGSLAWEAVLEVLDKGGVLAGCSAGAMILGEKLFGFPGWKWKDGFNFLPGTIVVPHYDEIPESFIAPIRLFAGKDLTILGIEANTALLQKGEEVEVVGSGGVTVWNGAGKIRYVRGSMPYWHSNRE
jgi:cyanophycinase